MIITTPAGDQRRVQIGQSMIGAHIRTVTIEPGDQHHPHFLSWFVSSVLPRIGPVEYTTQ